jgi:hypothetical protein
MQAMSAARAAATPRGLSSTTTHLSGGTPMVRAGVQVQVRFGLAVRHVLSAEDASAESPVESRGAQGGAHLVVAAVGGRPRVAYAFSCS